MLSSILNSQLSLIGSILINIFLLLVSNFQTSLSPSFKSNCLITLAGTVVRKDSLFLFALVKLVIWPRGMVHY